MSNRRRRAQRNTYRTGYLRSPQWFARRRRWFQDAGEDVTCVGCTRPGTQRTLDLHHVSYAGVTETDGKWSAQERHEDLWPMHPLCHELLHRLIDRDVILSRHRSREDASRIALRHVHARLAPKETS